MKKLIFLALLIPSLAEADVFINGNITADTEWSPDYGVYVLENQTTIASGTKLTILPGTIIKFRSHSGVMVVDGELEAKSVGTSTPIIFTSDRDDTYGGDTNADATSTSPMIRDWQGVLFNPGSRGEFENVKIMYGGRNVFGSGLSSGVTNRGGYVEIKNSLIAQNGNFGIYSLGGESWIENSIIELNLYGLYSENASTTFVRNVVRNNSGGGLDARTGGQLTLIDTVFGDNARTGTIEAGTEFIHSGNTSYDLSMRGFFMPGYPKDGFVFHSDDLPIILSGGYMSILASTTVTFAPGTVIKMDHWSNIQVYGNLNIEGTKSKPVVVTSLKDDSVHGDTNVDGETLPTFLEDIGLFSHSGSSMNIDNALFSYGLRPIVNDGGEVLVTSSKFASPINTGVENRSGNLTIHQSQILSANGVNNISSEVVDATNNWWGHESGPLNASTSTPSGSGSRIDGLVSYTPWVTRDPSLKNPAIIIPGIMGSYLEDEEGNEVWMNVSTMIISPSDDYLDTLILEAGGEESDNKSLFPNLIIKKSGRRDLFEGAINYFVDSGYSENLNLFTFPYDWRFDLSKTVEQFKNKIEDIKIKTGATKVDVVAHSMGGLLLKEYVRTHGGDSIGIFVDISTPHLGSPKSFKILSHGDNLNASIFGVDLMNPSRLKLISQNMPAVYQLLPSRDYFKDDPDYNFYIFNGVNGNDVLDYDETKRYLKDSGRNSLLLDRADEFHQRLAGLNPADYGVETYNIVGCGIPTLGQFYILEEKNGEYVYNIKMIDGDGTVPIRSSSVLPAKKTYYVRGVEHAVLPSASGVKELVANLLLDSDGVQVSGHILENDSTCGVPDGILVSFHSPIDLHVYDQAGNHSGPDVDGNVENNIPGVIYEVVGGNKFAFLPKTGSYTVSGESTGLGTFDLRMQEVVGGEVVKTNLFTDISINPDSNTQFQINGELIERVIVDSRAEEADLFEDGILMSNGQSETTLVVGVLTQIPTSSGKRSVAAKENDQPAVDVNVKKDIQFDIKVKNNPLLSRQLIESVTNNSLATNKLETLDVATVNQSLGDKLVDIFKSFIKWLVSKI